MVAGMDDETADRIALTSAVAGGVWAGVGNIIYDQCSRIHHTREPWDILLITSRVVADLAAGHIRMIETGYLGGMTEREAEAKAIVGRLLELVQRNQVHFPECDEMEIEEVKKWLQL